VLIVDDEESICWGLRRLLTDEGFDVSVASSAEEALEMVERQPPDLAMFDVRLPGLDGLTALERLRKSDNGFPVIVVTAYGNLETAVRAMENGAFDYVTKPFELEQVVDVVRRAAKAAKNRTTTTPAKPTDAPVATKLLGRSEPMQAMFKQIALAAPTDAAVLLVGESGTGKEVAARALHEHSARSGGPFVPIHLAALNPTLVESELFGHVRGAFTGADFERTGLLESADGGTVFFDEAADIPPGLQVKLLRAIERQEVTPVGDVRPRAVRFRVVSAMNRDPAECLRSGAVRPDLFYRLAGFEIRLPALRERGNDLTLLAEHFLLQAAGTNGANDLRFAESTLAELRRRTWPGNVRELRNVVEQAAVLARRGLVEPQHLPPPGRYEAAPGAVEATALAAAVRAWAETKLAAKADTGQLYEKLLAEIERPLFEAVLHQTLGNRAAAADLLGIHRATLRKKLNERRGE
jgi:two-component system nitrogen regulation response regulator GlnG